MATRKAKHQVTWPGAYSGPNRVQRAPHAFDITSGSYFLVFMAMKPLVVDGRFVQYLQDNVGCKKVWIHPWFTSRKNRLHSPMGFSAG